jgi:hypothetical protein
MPGDIRKESLGALCRVRRHWPGCRAGRPEEASALAVRLTAPLVACQAAEDEVREAVTAEHVCEVLAWQAARKEWLLR